jgi:transcriptional regulator with XRE-family HTH domain
MPRSNPARTLPIEAHVAANVAREREQRGMTYEGLALAMSNAGCPIQPSAIFKIEKGQPPRRITVNELWALSTALEVGIGELLEDPSVRTTPPEVWTIVRDVENQQRVIDRALYEIRQAVDQMKSVIGADPKLRAVLRRYLADGWSDWPEVRDHFKSVLRAQPSKKPGEQS